MGKILKGGCLCGRSRCEIDGEISFSIQCYCRDCQHLSGGDHAPQFAVKCSGAVKSGPLKTFTIKSDRENPVE